MRKMSISIKYNALTPMIYERIRDSAGFHHYSLEDVSVALSGGICSVVAFDDDIPVGIGRLVGDGRITFFVKDLVVLDKYQSRGVGSMILDSLMQYARIHGAPHAYIGLMSTPGKEGFYERNGFIRRPNEQFGSGMVRFLDS